MIKHADSLNFWQSARENDRNKELRPAWWANALLPEAVGAVGFPNVATLYSKRPESVYTHSVADIDNILDNSKLELTAVHQPPGRMTKLLQRILPDFQNYAYRNTALPGESPANFGRHGQVSQLGHEPPERWHIPSLAHEIGHAQEEHVMGPLARAVQHARPLGALGVLGGAIESFRALNNTPRSLDERKQMLDRASGIGGLATAPTLINEFRASRNGLRLLKNLPLENKAELLQEAGRLYPRAFSTYALMAAAPVLAPQIAKLFLPKHVD